MRPFSSTAGSRQGHSELDAADVRRGVWVAGILAVRRGSGAAQPAERGARDLGERRLIYRPSGKRVAHDVCRLDGPPVLQIHADERAVDDVRAVDDEMCCVSSARSKN